MARNKYPEVTVEKILDAAQRLFLEKGYENTTIQDIVGELGGLTKGAVYHHFKSKEEIMDAVNDRMFFSNNPFEAVQGRDDLSGLEKLRQAVLIHNADEEQGEINRQATALMKNPQMLANMLVANREVLTPYYRKLIDEGIADGSITTRYPRELSGGEMRRVSIARALMNQPSLLIADEPTGDLDQESTDIVMRLLRDQANNGTAILMVAHDPDALEYADRVYRMDAGVLSIASV